MFSLSRVAIRILRRVNYSRRSTSRLNSTEQLASCELPFPADDNFNIVRKEESKSLRIAILGAPNAGKSTLVNQLVNHQVCASSVKKHTTRVAYRAMLHCEDTEVVFVDTPGVVSSQEMKKHSLEDSFKVEPKLVLRTVDVIGVLHDVSKVSTRDRLHPEIINLLKSVGPEVPSLLLLNKVDKIEKKRKLLDFVQKLSTGNQWPYFVDVFMLSALSGDGVGDLRDYLLDSAKPRDWDFDQNTLTDQKPEDMVVRIVRANMMNALPAEIPYSLNVHMEHFNICDDGSISSIVLIQCPTERLYKLVIGKLKPQLRTIAVSIEQQLNKNFQRTVRVKLVVQPKGLEIK